MLNQSGPGAILPVTYLGPFESMVSLDEKEPLTRRSGGRQDSILCVGLRLLRGRFRAVVGLHVTAWVSEGVELYVFFLHAASIAGLSINEGSLPGSRSTLRSALDYLTRV